MSSATRPRRVAADGAGVYSKGRERAAGILDAAIRLLIDAGYHNLSMRAVADACGMGLGNLQHYFPTKDDLVRAMLDRVIAGYLRRFERIIEATDDPEAEFRAVIASVMQDLNKRRTTVLFPELWSLANHDRQLVPWLDRMYQSYRDVLSGLMLRMNPALTRRRADRLALFMSASIEGHTMFVGHGKPWRGETGALLAIAQQSFVWLVRSAEAGDD